MCLCIIKLEIIFFLIYYYYRFGVVFNKGYWFLNVFRIYFFYLRIFFLMRLIVVSKIRLCFFIGLGESYYFVLVVNGEGKWLRFFYFSNFFS